MTSALYIIRIIHQREKLKGKKKDLPLLSNNTDIIIKTRQILILNNSTKQILYQVLIK